MKPRTMEKMVLIIKDFIRKFYMIGITTFIKILRSISIGVANTATL